jgi:hypothetical protein
MEKVGIFYGHLEYIKAIRKILRTFGILVAILVFCFEKNLATLSAALWEGGGHCYKVDIQQIFDA